MIQVKPVYGNRELLRLNDVRKDGLVCACLPLVLFHSVRRGSIV